MHSQRSLDSAGPGFSGRLAPHPHLCPASRPYSRGPLRPQASFLDALKRQRIGRRAAVANTASASEPAATAPPAPAGPRLGGRVDQRYQLFLDEWDKGFSMEAKEEPEGYFVDVVYGAIPPEMCGTLFRNGPGRFTLGGRRIAHPYDGDGHVASLAIKDGAAFYRSRFVQTPEFQAEDSAQEVLFRGTFATQRAGGAAANAGDLYVKNTSNTNIVCHAGRLWSLFEAGQPYRLNARTLETEGLETLGGRLRPGLPFDLGSASRNDTFAGLTRLAHSRLGLSRHLPPELVQAGGDAVTAHPHLDPHTGRLCFFSYRVLPTVPPQPGQPSVTTALTFWELDAQGAPVTKKQFSLQGFAFLHDFAVTENYYVVFQNPVTVANTPYLLGASPAASCVRWAPGTPTLVHLIPRPGAAPDAAPATFAAPPLFVFHHANAYEVRDEGSEGQGDGGASGGSRRRVVVDSIHYNSLPAVGREALAAQRLDPDAAFTSRLRRVEIDLDTHVLSVRRLFDGYLEMPATNPAIAGRRHRFVYGYHSVFEDPQIGIAKIDVDQGHADVWLPGPCRFALEPRFIPRPGGAGEEDSGWLIAQLFDSEAMRSEIVILDAARLGAGPVAVLRLRDALPSALHSCWSDDYFAPGRSDGESDAIGRRREQELANVVPFGPKGAKETARLRGTAERRPASSSRRALSALPLALAALFRGERHEEA